MKRTWHKLAAGVALAAGPVLAVGCDGAKDAAKKAEKAGGDAVKDVKKTGDDAKAKVGEVADKAADAAKTAIIDPIKDLLPKIEEKIKGLTGDKMTAAKEQFDKLKKLVADFSAAPADKVKELGEELKKVFDELKKSVGL